MAWGFLLGGRNFDDQAKCQFDMFLVGSPQSVYPHSLLLFLSILPPRFPYLLFFYFLELCMKKINWSCWRPRSLPHNKHLLPPIFMFGQAAFHCYARVMCFKSELSYLGCACGSCATNVSQFHMNLRLECPPSSNHWVENQSELPRTKLLMLLLAAHQTGVAQHDQFLYNVVALFEHFVQYFHNHSLRHNKNKMISFFNVK